MEPSWTHKPEITLSKPFGAAARAVFALLGYAAVVASLRQAAADGAGLAWVTGFAALCGLGLAYVLLNSFGKEDIWTLKEHELVLERRTPWRLSKVRFRRREIATTTICAKAVMGADGKKRETFALALVSKGGRSHLMPPLPSLTKAQELETELRARLGLPPVSH